MEELAKQCPDSLLMFLVRCFLPDEDVSGETLADARTPSDPDPEEVGQG